MALHDVSAIRSSDLVTIPRDLDPFGHADSVRQILEGMPDVREALQIDDNRMGRIRFDGEWGVDDDGDPVSKVIVPIGRRDDDAVRAFMRIFHNSSDIEIDGVIFAIERKHND